MSVAIRARHVERDAHEINLSSFHSRYRFFSLHFQIATSTLAQAASTQNSAHQSIPPKSAVRPTHAECCCCTASLRRRRGAHGRSICGQRIAD